MISVDAGSKANRLLVDPSGTFFFVGLDNGSVIHTSLNPAMPLNDTLTGHTGKGEAPEPHPAGLASTPPPARGAAPDPAK